MSEVRSPPSRPSIKHWLRSAFAAFPTPLRFAAYRALVRCDPSPDPRLRLKIASTQAELEACFGLLHDAYVGSRFMQPHPSGLRVTPYHALPTTTTLCATFDGQVVGTLSIVREGVFGFPMQSAFDLSGVRRREGRIAEISALAIHPAFRQTGGTVLFPLMKFMYEYCMRFFDTRHLVIAVHPRRIELYDALLAFQRLQAQPVDEYDFANGAPAIGAALDLHAAPGVFKTIYGSRAPARNLHRYFVQSHLPNIEFPDRSYFTSTDPVLTPPLFDHFFRQRTDALSRLNPRQVHLLHSVYPSAAWKAVLPDLPASEATGAGLRRHRRFSMSCPATLTFDRGPRRLQTQARVIEVSKHGFQAAVNSDLPEGARCLVDVALAVHESSRIEAVVARRVESVDGTLCGFRVDTPDAAWLRCIEFLRLRDQGSAVAGPIAQDLSRRGAGLAAARASVLS